MADESAPAHEARTALLAAIKKASSEGDGATAKALAEAYEIVRRPATELGSVEALIREYNLKAVEDFEAKVRAGGLRPEKENRPRRMTNEEIAEEARRCMTAWAGRDPVRDDSGTGTGLAGYLTSGGGFPRKDQTS